MSSKKQVIGSGAQLVEFLITEFKRKNDAHISRDLMVAPPVISKIRNGHLPVGDSFILAIHERYGVDVKIIREQAGVANKFGKAND